MAEKLRSEPESVKSAESAPPTIEYEHVPLESDVAERVSTAVVPSVTESVVLVDHAQVYLESFKSLSSDLSVSSDAAPARTKASVASASTVQGLGRVVRLSVATRMYRKGPRLLLKQIAEDRNFISQFSIQM